MPSQNLRIASRFERGAEGAASKESLFVNVGVFPRGDSLLLWHLYLIFQMVILSLPNHPLNLLPRSLMHVASYSLPGGG